jgi:signal transduction histidine kinase
VSWRRPARRAARALRRAALGHGVLRHRFARRGLILLYHRVTDVRPDPWLMCVTPRHFAEHLEVLREHGRTVKLARLVRALMDGAPLSGSVAVTFDDGYADNIESARPLLDRYDVPAAVFVTSGFVGGGTETWWDELERLVLGPGTLPEIVVLRVSGGEHRWELGAAARYGEGEAARHRCEEVIALDRSRPIRYQRRMPNGKVMEIGSDPTPDGGFVVTHSDVTGLVQAQAEASQRAATLQVMLDTMRHGIALYGPDRRLRMANRLGHLLSGMPPDEPTPIGATVEEVASMHLRLGLLGEGEQAEARLAEMVALDRSVPHRSQRSLPDGRVVEVASDPTPDGGFVITFSDVTQLTRLEAEARRRADILQVMLDNMRHGICYYGPDRRVIAANALASDLGGHLPGSLVPGRTLDELVAQQMATGAVGGDAQAVAAMALSMDRSRPHRYVRPHRDGRMVEVTSDPTPDGGFVVTMTDISALAQAEAEAKRRAEIQQAMLDNIRLGILLVDGEGRVVAANSVFRQLLGLPEGVVSPGRPFTDFVDWLADRGEYGEGEEGRRVAAAIRDRDRRRSVRSVRTRPDGTVLEAISDPTPDGGWVLTFTDLTEERRVQAELARARDAAEAANRAKSRFLATMSHELRTPLNAVIGFSEALIAGPPRDAAEEYLRSIHDAGRHLLSLIDDILDVTRAETTGFPVTEGTVDIAALAEEAVRVMGATAAAGQVALRIALSPGLPRVRADAVRMRQVLLNLISNAVKFTPAGGTVTLSAGRDPPEGGDAAGLALRIADTGIGIRPEDIPRAFEAFTQLDGALSRRFLGSGLGLYLSRALAAAQGMKLSLESTTGQGTTAVLRIPQERLAAPAVA